MSPSIRRNTIAYQKSNQKQKVQSILWTFTVTRKRKKEDRVKRKKEKLEWRKSKEGRKRKEDRKSKEGRKRRKEEEREKEKERGK